MAAQVGGHQCQLTGCATKKKELRVRVDPGASVHEHDLADKPNFWSLLTRVFKHFKL